MKKYYEIFEVDTEDHISSMGEVYSLFGLLFFMVYFQILYPKNYYFHLTYVI